MVLNKVFMFLCIQANGTHVSVSYDPFYNVGLIMKNITTIISAFLFIASLIILDMHLSESKKHIPVVVKQHGYLPVSTHLCNEKTESLPFNRCNCEKQVEGANVVNFRFVNVRKAFSRHNLYASQFLLTRRTALLLPIKYKAPFGPVTHTVHNITIHVRNCVWLI